MHASSLGEMEQGLPILKQLRKRLPQHQIILSFFSPSGYENFQDRELCDYVCYLPIDLPREAEDFAEILQADLALFIKYDIWPNILKALSKQKTKLFLAPALFRKNQIYFRNYAGSFFKNSLKRFDQIHVQDQISLDLLRDFGHPAVFACGDSRFDRALENTRKAYPLQLNQSLQPGPCLVAGSTWPQEEKLIKDLIKDRDELSLIIAPHDVSQKNIERLGSTFSEFGLLKLSEIEEKQKPVRIILVDSIGNLKYLYRFANIVLIGGGFGKGVHSTIEAAVYYKPILFGPNHNKFIETNELLELGLALEIPSTSQKLLPLVSQQLGKCNERNFQASYSNYISSKLGAANKIAETILLKIEVDEAG